MVYIFHGSVLAKTVAEGFVKRYWVRFGARNLPRVGGSGKSNAERSLHIHNAQLILNYEYANNALFRIYD